MVAAEQLLAAGRISTHLPVSKKVQNNVPNQILFKQQERKEECRTRKNSIPMSPPSTTSMNESNTAE
jgi:hypothetical protein